MSWGVGLIVGIPAAKTPGSASVLTRPKAEENTGRKAPSTLQQMLRIHIRAPSCQRIESICRARLWRGGMQCAAVGIPATHGQVQSFSHCQFILAAGRRHGIVQRCEGYSHILIRIEVCSRCVKKGRLIRLNKNPG